MSDLARQKPAWAERLLRERLLRGWSRSDMAREMRRAASRLTLGALDPERIAEYVKRWEKGHVGAPDARHQMTIAGALGMSVREVFGTAAYLISDRPGSANRSSSSDDDLPYYDSAEDDVIGRRRFLAWLAALSAGTATLPDSVRQIISIVKDQNPDTLRRITAADVANLRASTEVFQTWGHKVGGGLSRHAIIGQLGWAVHQLDMGVPASSELLREWQKASARLASLAGFESHDCGHEQQARGLMVLGYWLASEADDRARQADALAAMAMQAVHIGRPHTGLDLARHGLELADDATPISRAILHGLKARAYGRLGDMRALEREVGLAEQEHARIVPDDYEREPWLSFYNEAELYGDTGTAWRMLAWHHPDQAGRRGQRAVSEAGSRLSLAADGHGAEFARSRALCHLMAAGVYLRARDPDAAVAVRKGEVLAFDTSGIHSVRVEGFARDFAKAAQPFKRRSDVQEMLGGLAVVT
ncbi:MAG: hypothetical protein ACRDRH_17575 [Pseudonocardia sp.]